jgi:hypothetical protein
MEEMSLEDVLTICWSINGYKKEVRWVVWWGARGVILWIKMRACSQVVKLNIHPLRKEEREKQRGRVDTATFMYPILTVCWARFSVFSQFRRMAVRCQVWRDEIFNGSYTSTPFCYGGLNST